MKNTRYIPFLPFLLASLTLASSAMAQTTEDQRTETEPDTRITDSIAAARSQYTRTSDLSPGTSDTTIAQLRRGGRGRPFPAQRGYPRGTYQTPWMHHGSAGHILIGAAIGFGVGAALGANHSAHNGTPVGGGIIVGGGLFGLIGGCVGKAVGDLQGLHYSSARRRRTYLPSWPEEQPEDDEQTDLRPHSNAKEDRPEASPKRALLHQTADVEAMAAASPIPAVP